MTAGEHIIEVMASTLQATVSAALAGEFQALLSGAGVCLFSGRGFIQAAGNDRVRWLNGMVSNKIRDLAEGSGAYAFVLNPQGKILGDLYAFNRGESILIETDQQQGEKLFGLLRRYIIMDKVELTDVSERWAVIGVAGPKAKETLQRAGVEMRALEPLQFAPVTIAGVAATLVRADNPAVESYEIRVGGDGTEENVTAKDTKESAGEIAGALARAGAAAVSEEAWELMRIAAGIPRYGADIRERDLPQETEQLRALNFNKGCYIGQEIVERIRSRGNVHRTFTGFEFQDEALPEPGAKVVANGKEVGEITSAAVLPFPEGERRVALGYIRREAAEGGAVISAGANTGVVAKLPFVNS
jgi:folate-binding protein YgfZ